MYRNRFADLPGELVYQASIWTDVQSLFTAINFETKQYADDERNKLLNNFLSRVSAEVAETVSELPYSTNSAGFKHPEFYTITHENLSPLCDIDYFHHGNEEGVKARFEQFLLKVMEKIISDGLLLTLPREETLWIGINSARYWYDHVRLIQ